MEKDYTVTTDTTYEKLKQPIRTQENTVRNATINEKLKQPIRTQEKNKKYSALVITYRVMYSFITSFLG